MSYRNRIERIESSAAIQRTQTKTRKPFNHRVIELLCVRDRELTAEEKSFLAVYASGDRVFNDATVDRLIANQRGAQ